MGDAPRLLIVVGPALIIAVVAELLFPRAGSFTLRYRQLFVSVAIVLTALAVPFWISAGFELLAAWKRKSLAVRGSYALCRHPIFAAWIWFVLPVAAFFADSWYFLAVELVFVAATIVGARREESDMVSEFGEAYETYRVRVRSLVPIPRLRPLSAKRLRAGAIGVFTIIVYVVIVLFLIGLPTARRVGTSDWKTSPRLSVSTTSSPAQPGSWKTFPA